MMRYSRDAWMRRYQLTDEAWVRIRELMPPADRPGGRWNDHRVVLDGIFWVLNSGASWRDMPERYGPWQSVYHRFRRWIREGLFDRILQTLQLQLDDEGHIDWSQFDVDGTCVRVHCSAAGARKKRCYKNLQIMDLEEAEGVRVASFIW